MDHFSHIILKYFPTSMCNVILCTPASALVVTWGHFSFFYWFISNMCLSRIFETFPSVYKCYAVHFSLFSKDFFAFSGNTFKQHYAKSLFFIISSISLILYISFGCLFGCFFFLVQFVYVWGKIANSVYYQSA